MRRKPQKKDLGIATLLQGHGSYEPGEHGNHLNPPLYLDIAPVQPDIETAAAAAETCIPAGKTFEMIAAL